MDNPMIPNTDFLFYSADDGTLKVQVRVEDETVWLTQKGMAKLFQVDVRTISEHLQTRFKTGELDEISVVRKFRITANDKKQYNTMFYNLDAIISIGYRVHSLEATNFRKWATEILTKYLIKGYVLNNDRLKQGDNIFGKEYFSDLLEEIRDIRASERLFYQKITDLYATSYDYDKISASKKQGFFSKVQNKLHFAEHGHTSAELIKERASSKKSNMGLTSWKNQKKGGKIIKHDVSNGKNYLKKDELEGLNRLVSMYLDFAENMTKKGIKMSVKDWGNYLDDFLNFNHYEVLENKG